MRLLSRKWYKSEHPNLKEWIDVVNGKHNSLSETEMILSNKLGKIDFLQRKRTLPPWDCTPLDI